ncbi:MAG: hypothetical protein IJ133_01835, partial [Clostridia bacterium]|nr:hypothetical protein [Clostridia bacterium]
HLCVPFRAFPESEAAFSFSLFLRSRFVACFPTFWLFSFYLLCFHCLSVCLDSRSASNRIFLVVSGFRFLLFGVLPFRGPKMVPFFSLWFSGLLSICCIGGGGERFIDFVFWQLGCDFAIFGLFLPEFSSYFVFASSSSLFGAYGFPDFCLLLGFENGFWAG